jgi:hypothetical protein
MYNHIFKVAGFNPGTGEIEVVEEKTAEPLHIKFTADPIMLHSLQNNQWHVVNHPVLLKDEVSILQFVAPGPHPNTIPRQQ